MSFKTFLINEDKAYLGHKVSDVLTAVHDLQDDMEHMGSRQTMRLADDIVNRIRKILHGQWSVKQQKHLETLQKAAVALKKTIEDKGDLKQMIPNVAQELEGLSTKLGVKTTNALDQAAELGGEDASQEDMEITPPDQDPNQMQQGMQDPNQMQPDMQDPMMQQQDPTQMQDPNMQAQPPMGM